MTSIIDNPIYQHSGETEKISPLACQASINEDIEKRRRLLDKKGETRKIIIAKEVSHFVDEGIDHVHLRHTPYTVHQASAGILESSKSLIDSVAHTTVDAAVTAQHTVADAARAAADTLVHAASAATETVAHAASATAGAISHAASATAEAISHAASATTDSMTHAASATAEAITHAAAATTDTVTHAASATADKLAHAASATADTAAHVGSKAATLGYDAALSLGHATKNAAGIVGHAASSLAEKAVETTSDVVHAAGHVKDRAIDLAEEAATKTHAVVDNLSSYAAHLSLIAQEERERARRLTDADEVFAIQNAQKVSDLLHALGPSFYRQEPANQLYGTKLLEEFERKWRLSSPYSAIAASNAHSLGKLVSKDLNTFAHHVTRLQLVRLHIRELEEKERTRRMNDSDEVWAMLNAFTLRNKLVDLGWPYYRQENQFGKFHRLYATTLMEENERRYRIRTHQLYHPQSLQQPGHALLDIVSANLNSFSFSARQAAHFFQDFASKLGSAAANITSSFSEKTKDFAKSTLGRVRAVAGDISHFSAIMYVMALEERERQRRINDADEVTAIVNAWNQSALIRQLEALYHPGSTRRAVFPARYLEELERRVRINQDDTAIRARALAVAKIVQANLAKFEHAGRSRLNPYAKPFVPHTSYQDNSLAPSFKLNIIPLVDARYEGAVTEKTSEHEAGSVTEKRTEYEGKSSTNFRAPKQQAAGSQF